MNNDKKWYFGTTTGGLVQGSNSGESELFGGKNILSSTVKEIIQNSLDAQVDPSKPVEVRFNLKRVASTSIPGQSQLRQCIQKAADYWGKNGGTETSHSLMERYKVLKQQTVPVLIVGDYNTTGLSSPMEDDVMVGDWNKLVRMNGGGTKIGNKNGSKGLGKNAPFALSSLGLVFYRTINSDYERVAQGVVHLVNYPANPERNSYYNGVGYYGNGSKPVRKISWINDLSFRKDTGTDVIIVGFPQNKIGKWTSTVIQAVLDNYMFAIYKGNLRVIVDDREIIDQDTLEKYLKKYATNSAGKRALSFYRAISAPDSITASFEIEGLKGKVIVHYAFKPYGEETLVQRILLTRSSGMKLKDMNCQSAFPFCAVLEMEGKELNEYFRKLEPATHDDWNPEYDKKNPGLAKQRLEFLKEQIVALAEQSIESSGSQTMDIDWLGEHEGLKRSTYLDKRTASAKIKGGGILSINPESKVKVKSKPAKVKGTVDKNGSNSAQKSYEGKRDQKRGPGPGRKGTENPAGVDEVTVQHDRPVDIRTIRARTISLKNGFTRIVIQSPKEIQRASLSLKVLGEGQKSYDAKVISVNSTEGVETAKLVHKSGKVELTGIQADQMLKLDLATKDSLKNKSLGVVLEVYKK